MVSPPPCSVTIIVLPVWPVHLRAKFGMRRGYDVDESKSAVGKVQGTTVSQREP